MARFRGFFLFIGCICALLSGGVSLAQEEGQSAAAYTLSLDEVTRLAINNNFDIQLAKYDVWIARTDQGKAESIYDTILDAEVKYRNDQSKPTSTILGTKTLDNDYNIGLTKKLPTGTTLELNSTNNRHWSNSIFTSAPLTHDSTVGVTVTQELGKNFFGLQDRAGIKVTALDIENSQYTSLDKIEQSVADVQTAYWDLALQEERVKIDEDMLTQAKTLYDLHQEKYKDGLVELPELLASQANYETRQNDLMLARNTLEAKSNVLKLLLNVAETDGRLGTTHDFARPQSPVSFTASLKDALDARRDYQKALNDIKAKGLNLSMKKNGLWPEINLTASLARNGLGDHFKQAINQIGEEDNPNFYAGLEISFPLENREAKAEMKAAELEKAKALINLKLTERKIAIEIADQVRNCNIYQELARNRAAVSGMQEEKLKEEEKRFRYGRSDTDTIIRFQEDLLKALDSETEAKYLYHTALVALERKEGTLLKKYWEGKL